MQKKIDMVLCKIYKKATTQKSMEQRANHSLEVDNKELVDSTDEYQEKCYSKSVNVSCKSNPKTDADANDCSLHYLDHEGDCSSLFKTMDESNLLDCLEPIMSCEESMVLKTPTTCKLPPKLELANLSMDCIMFSQTVETPYALLSTPSEFQIPL